MHLYRFGCAAIALALMFCTATIAQAVGFELRETKDQLKLKYDVSVHDHGTGRVTITFTLSDEGRMKPLDRGVDFVIPSKDGTGYADLSLALNHREVDGEQVMTIHLLRELAERAEIQLKTSSLDGKREALSWCYHRIPIANYMKDLEPKKK